MVELGKLEAKHEQFDQRGVRIVAVSLDDLKNSAETQAKFPHLTIISDQDRGLANVAQVVGPHHGPDGETLSPTTILVDRHGQVKWLFRPELYINRLTPDELLAAVKDHFSEEPGTK
jgi:peroxiredoxin